MTTQQNMTNRQFLREQQYKDSSNLQKRATIHSFAKDDGKEPWFSWLFSHLVMPERGELLEVGCGHGLLWQENLDRIPALWHITLSDLSVGMINEAKMSLGEGFIYQQADVMNLPFADGQFHAVIANHMLYHVPNVAQGLSEIKRSLKEGGYLFASTVGESHMQELVTFINAFRDHAINLRGLHSFTLENGEAQLKEHFSFVSALARPRELFISDPQALIDYACSSPALAPDDDKLEPFIQTVHNIIKQEGHFYTQTSAGLFIACP